MSIVFEVLFEIFKKLFRFFGPAIFVFVVLIIEIIAMPDIADSKAASEARHLEFNEVLYFKEIGYDEETEDRIFEVKLRNNSPDPSTFSSLYITTEDGRIVYNTLKNEFEDLRLNDRFTVTYYIPPGSESIAYIYIDDYKLEGVDHLYVTDTYSDVLKGKRFDIEKK